MIQCCGEDMLISNGWHYCKKCNKRLVEIPHDRETNVLALMIVDYVDEFDVGWTTLKNIVHELWKQGHYEGYEPKLSDKWSIDT